MSNRQKSLLVAIFLIAVILRFIPGPRTIDDAYITYRYARNILAGNGFVYNPGEHVLGTTTPLYTILLAILGLFLGGITAPFPQIALVLNALADGITCVFLVKLGKSLGFAWAGWGSALVWAVAPYSVTFAIGGLETSLFVLLLVATTWLYLQKMYPLAAFTASFSFLTRPDSLIFLGPLALDFLWLKVKENQGWFISLIKNHSVQKSSLTFGLPIAVWLTFATLYFGDPFPHSIAAKTVAYRLPENAALIRLIQHFATPFMEQDTLGIHWIWVGLFLYPFLSLLGIRRAIIANSRAWPFIVYPWLYFTTFAIANPLIFRWYLTPPLPAYILSIFIGLESMLLHSFSKFHFFNYKKINRIFSFVLIIGFPLIFSIKNWTLQPDHGLNHPAPKMAWYQLELLYRESANILAPEIMKNQQPVLLAAGDVGVLGYYTNAVILDTVGLNSPQSIKYYPLDPTYYSTNYAVPPDLILDTRPDYVVIMEVYGRNGLLKSKVFQENYSLIKIIPTDIYDSQGMLIFKRLK